MITACEKNEITLDDATIVEDDALFKLGYFSPNSSNPGVQLKINDARVSYLFTNATPFPGGGYNTGGSSNSDYVVVKPGQTKVSISIPKKGTNEDSIVVLNTTVNLEARKKYSMFTSDTIPNVKAFMVEDVFVTPDSGFAKVRFTNLMANVPAVDFYQNGILIKANVALNTCTDFMDISIANNPSNFQIRPAGALATTTALAVYPAAATFTLTNTRIYTIIARGYSGTTDTQRKPNVSLILNR
jgi:hypothetical protein